MPNVCEVCGTRLYRGKAGNYGSCAVCPIKICFTCTKSGFCPTHFNALSPLGQDIIKRAYKQQFLRTMILFSVILAIGLGLFLTGIPGLSPLLFPLWFLADIVVVFVRASRDKDWTVAFWRRDTEKPTPIPDTWHCDACGFENPTLAQTCAQCGRNKSASLRIA